jgi:hypothetical protein
MGQQYARYGDDRVSERYGKQRIARHNGDNVFNRDRLFSDGY